MDNPSEREILASVFSPTCNIWGNNNNDQGPVLFKVLNLNYANHAIIVTILQKVRFREHN